MGQEHCHYAHHRRHDVPDAVPVYYLVLRQSFDFAHQYVFLAHLIGKSIPHKICTVPYMGYDDGCHRQYQMQQPVCDAASADGRHSTLGQHTQLYSKDEYEYQCHEKFRYAVCRHACSAYQSVRCASFMADAEYGKQKSKHGYQYER